MKKIYTLILILFAVVAVNAQEPFKGEVTLTCNAIEERGDMLYLDLSIHVSRQAMNTCNSWTIVPQLVGAPSQVISFPYVLINGNNKRQIFDRRLKFENEILLSDLPYQMVNVKKDTDTTLRYAMEVPYEMWMDDASLIVRQILTSCADQRQLFTVDVAKNVTLAPRLPYEVSPLVVFVVPERETVKSRNIQAQAYLDFQVGRSTIIPGFRRNPEELAKIQDILRGVQNDNDVQITGMFIEGYASPEGSYELNTRLSRERADALANYIANNFGVHKDIVRSSSVPEDWEGLRIMVEESNIPFREEVLRIIDSDLAPDVKERQIKAYPSAYRRMVTEMFPSLRRSEYRVDFTVKDYTLDESRVMLDRDPSRLSHYELYLLADTYQAGTAEHDRIYDIIQRQYPDDPAANINTAVILLNRGEYTGAKRRLESAGNDAAALNALGVIYLKEGDLDAAETALNRAKALGSTEAIHNLNELELKRQDNEKMERYRNR